MGRRLPSVGEASRSIRHDHVSVKDTHASLARAARRRDTGGEPLRLGGSRCGQREPCLGQHACDTGEEAGLGTPQAGTKGVSQYRQGVLSVGQETGGVGSTHG